MLKSPLTNKYYQTFSGADTLVYLLMEKGTKATLLGALSTISYSSYRVKRPVHTVGTIVARVHTFGPRTVGGTMIFSVVNSNFVEELLINNEWLRKHGHLKADELPLFDLMIVSANEYGAYMQAFISGVSIVDEGQVLSVEDMFSENTFSFVAKDYIPFSDFARNNSDPSSPTTVKDGGIKIPTTPVNLPKDDQIYINDSLVKLVYGGIIKKDGRNHVPLRDMFDALGWPTWWEDERDEARVKIGEHYLNVNPKTGMVTGNYLTEVLKKKEFKLSVMPEIRETGTGHRTYIPIGILFPEIGYTVTYDAATKRIDIKGKQGTGGINEDLTTKDIQEHLIRFGFTKVKMTGTWDAATKDALKQFCSNMGFVFASAVSSDYTFLSDELKVALTRPDAGYVLKQPEKIQAKTKESIKIYVNNSTTSRVLRTVDSKTTFTITKKMQGWNRISSPMVGWVESRLF